MALSTDASGPATEMPERNPSREIAFIIALAVAFAAGLYAYISSTIESPKGPVLVASSAMRAAERDTRPDDARRIAGAFVQHLASARHEDAYLMMAEAYRQTTPLTAFRASCTASPCLSTASSVSLSRTREERAAGQRGRGSLTGTGVLVTRSGTVDVTFFFVDDPTGVAIVSLNVAGTPAFPMGAPAVIAPSASGTVKKR
jgi:hypothetical protein